MLNSNPQAKIQAHVNKKPPINNEGVNDVTKKSAPMDSPDAAMPHPKAPPEESFLARKWREGKEWATDAAIGYAVDKMDSMMSPEGKQDGKLGNNERPNTTWGPHRSDPKQPKANRPTANSPTPNIPTPNKPTPNIPTPNRPQFKVPKSNFGK